MQSNPPPSYLSALNPRLRYLCLKLAIATFQFGHSTNPILEGNFASAQLMKFAISVTEHNIAVKLVPTCSIVCFDVKL
jgi:hypothetical protein